MATANFGLKIRTARLHLGWSQKRLGEAVSVSGSAVGLWEKCKSVPGPHIVPKLTKTLGISQTAFERSLQEANTPARREVVVSDFNELALLEALRQIPGKRRAFFISLLLNGLRSEDALRREPRAEGAVKSPRSSQAVAIAGRANKKRSPVSRGRQV